MYIHPPSLPNSHLAQLYQADRSKLASIHERENCLFRSIWRLGRVPVGISARHLSTVGIHSGGVDRDLRIPVFPSRVEYSDGAIEQPRIRDLFPLK